MTFYHVDIVEFDDGCVLKVTFNQARVH